MVVPCAVKLTLLGGKEDRIPSDCETDKAKAIDWLQNFNIISYYNEALFQQEKYYTERISRQSTLMLNQMDEHKPSWIPTFVQRNTIEDEADLL